MSGHEVCIGALGMVSPLGHDVASSCAAARAGINRSSELKVVSQPFGKLGMDGPPAVYGHEVPGVGEGFSGAGKVLTLGAAALRDLLSRRPIDAHDAARTGLVVCLSDHAVLDAHEAQVAVALGSRRAAPSVAWREKAPALALALADQAGIAVQPRHVSVLTEGSPGFARALQEATSRVAGGSVDRCLVGAIDSRIEPRFLTAAAGLGALRTNDRPVGLIGGEAAAFVLVERMHDVRSSGRSPIAIPSGIGFGEEPTGHFADAPASGRALASAILGALAASPSLGASLALLIGDLNGTERRGYEWGMALARLRAAGMGTELPTWYPATSFGDTGAASGAVFLCVAARAFARGYAPGRGALLWMQSESGRSAAIGLEAPR